MRQICPDCVFMCTGDKTFLRNCRHWKCQNCWDYLDSGLCVFIFQLFMFKQVRFENLLAVLLLMSSDHFVLVGLRLTNPLWCDVADLLGHFLELQLADGRGNKMIGMMVKRRAVVEGHMTQATRGQTCQKSHLEAKSRTPICYWYVGCCIPKDFFDDLLAWNWLITKSISANKPRALFPESPVYKRILDIHSQKLI